MGLFGLSCHSFTAVIYVVNQHELAYVASAGVKCPSLVDAGHAVNKIHQLVVILQHEGIDDDVFLGAAFNFFQGLLLCPVAGGIAEKSPVSLQVSRGLPVGYAQNLASASLFLGKELAGQHQSVMQVGA